MKKILISMPLVLLTAIIVGYFAMGSDTRGIITYFGWKAFSADSGKGRYCQVDGTRIYYEIHGRGEPLLLLHGGTAFIESFFMQIPAFAKEFQVIAPDSRGHGRSNDPGGPLSYESMASDMAGLLKALNIKSAYVVGWSDGGIIGIELAVRRPGLVKKLVAIGSNFRTDGLNAESIEFTKTMGPDSEELAEVRDFYRWIAPDPGRWPVLVRKIKTMWLSEPNFTPADLSRITAPTLIIVGERDMIRKEHTVAMSSLIKGSRYEIIAGATHKVPMEKADIINGMIIGFLKRGVYDTHN